MCILEVIKMDSCILYTCNILVHFSLISEYFCQYSNKLLFEGFLFGPLGQINGNLIYWELTKISGLIFRANF